MYVTYPIPVRTPKHCAVKVVRKKLQTKESLKVNENIIRIKLKWNINLLIAYRFNINITTYWPVKAIKHLTKSVFVSFCVSFFFSLFTLFRCVSVGFWWCAIATLHSCVYFLVFCLLYALRYVTVSLFVLYIFKMCLINMSIITKKNVNGDG